MFVLYSCSPSCLLHVFMAVILPSSFLWVEVFAAFFIESFFGGGKSFIFLALFIFLRRSRKRNITESVVAWPGRWFFFSTTPFLLTRNKFLELGFPSPSKASQLQWLLWEFIETFVPSMPIFDSLCFIFILFFSPLKQSEFFFKLKTLSEIIKSFLLHFSVGFWGVSIMVISACKATIAACIWN